MIDCSHANSGKRHDVQPEVASAVAAQVASGSQNVMGVMLESFLVAGRQDLAPGTPLVRGQSITDACLSWEDTEPLFALLAEAVRSRRG
jgi:3-deoxy-7-phosphoheptulonate synthase